MQRKTRKPAYGWNRPLTPADGERAHELERQRQKDAERETEKIDRPVPGGKPPR